MKSLTDMVGDLNISTEQVLTALRIVATRAGVEDLASWAAKELEGYKDEDELPSHRIWPLTVVANLYDPKQGYMPRVHVPIVKKYRKEATTFHCRSGVGEIESSLANNTDQPMGVEHPNLAQIVNVSLQRPWSCTNATAEFSPVHLKEIVRRARQTALTLCLECERKGIDLQYSGGNEDASHRERKAWLKTLKQEATKSAIREIWSSVRDLAMGIQA